MDRNRQRADTANGNGSEYATQDDVIQRCVFDVQHQMRCTSVVIDNDSVVQDGIVNGITVEQFASESPECIERVLRARDTSCIWRRQMKTAAQWWTCVPLGLLYNLRVAILDTSKAATSAG